MGGGGIDGGLGGQPRWGQGDGKDLQGTMDKGFGSDGRCLLSVMNRTAGVRLPKNRRPSPSWGQQPMNLCIMEHNPFT